MPLKAIHRLFVSSASVFALTSGTGTAAELVISNHQQFPIRMPIELPLTVKRHSSVGVVPSASRLQRLSDTHSVAVLDLPASSTRTLQILELPLPALNKWISVTPSAHTVSIHHGSESRGDLDWGLFLVTAPKAASQRRQTTNGANSESAREATGDELANWHPDFASTFSPLPLKFKETEKGPVFTRYTAETTTAGLNLAFELDAYNEGFLDVRTRLTNQDAQTTGVYCAIVTRWKQPKFTRRSAAYNSIASPLEETTVTRFRDGEGHHWAIQRGLDWINTEFRGGSTAWLYDFSHSFTAFHPGTRKTPPRWINANQPQLAQEAQSTPEALYMVTEISRGVIKRFADRFMPFVLPGRGESTSFKSRLVFSAKTLSDEQVDQMFIGYTSYREQATEPQPKLSIGVPHVKFGTSYFPYSTLGENFGPLKLAGQDREGYWPLSADTVTQWRLFQDDIKRDFRIAKAMGFEVLRLHHLELLADIDPAIKQEYLDFFFGELKHLGMKALLDVQMKAEEVAGLVERYGPRVDGVEVENEILIWGIKEGREKYWNSVYNRVKKVDPQMPVNLTAHSNTGIFDRLEQLGASSDRIGFHSYVDTLDAIQSARDMALAVGNYAGEVGKPAVITEWNWRFMTRIPFEERAKHYHRIVGDALKTRSITEFQQFQFIESLAMNPRGLRGIRHYEPIFLSRRPKPEAFELQKLMHEYGDPGQPSNMLRVSHEVVEIQAGKSATIQVQLENRSDEIISLNVYPEPVGGLEITSGPEIKKVILEPRSVKSVEVYLITRKDAPPGFYHGFLRFDGFLGPHEPAWGTRRHPNAPYEPLTPLPLKDPARAFLHYAWIEARLAGQPKLDLDTQTTVTYPRGVKEELALDFTKPVTVVYGDMNSAGPEVEYAIMVANSLESATGRVVNLYNGDTLPYERRGDTLIAVGTPETNRFIRQALGSATPAGDGAVHRVRAPGASTDWLLITGKSTDTLEEATADFVLRYWRHAKDSATRRVGNLVRKTLPAGSDPTKLP